MSAETVLNAALLAASSITSVVGSRIYPSVVPEDQKPPCIAYERTATEYLNTIHGTSLGEDVDLSVWCMSRTIEGANALADEVETVARTVEFVILGRQIETEENAPGGGLWAAILSIRRFDT